MDAPSWQIEVVPNRLERIIHLSLPMLDRFEEEMGQRIDLRRVGYLFLLDSEDDLAAFRQNVALQNRLGVPSQMMRVDEVADRVPLLNLAGIIGRLKGCTRSRLRIGR